MYDKVVRKIQNDPFIVRQKINPSRYCKIQSAEPTDLRIILSPYLMTLIVVLNKKIACKLENNHLNLWK
jgi:hypothetical protein